MRQAASNSTSILGFLTVVEHPEQGLFGGYLLLNHTGRPLEFHCTAPIRPNRAQRILYGPSLGPFLYGEQIGATLVRHAKAAPLAVLTDCEFALAVREHIEPPVALVLPPDSGSVQTPESDETPAHSIRFDGAHAGADALRPHRTADGELILFEVGPHQLAVPRQCEADRNALADRLAQLPAALDLAEPFGRIHEAIAEARKAAR
ncbi:MAG: hypothetical protein RBS80_29380 [Thermoguttaceae bacterium]|jgi:hypothetical protein|nr:hypothetical protein [Thermoguttaceae bacterium]